MSRLTCTLPLLLMLLAVAVPASARQALTGSLLYTTDYISGGYSKSDGHGAVLGNLDYRLNTSIYGGLWIATVDFDDAQFVDHARTELAPYVSYVHSFNGWRLGGSASYYLYDGRIFGRTSHYGAVHLNLMVQDYVTARIGWFPNYYRRGKPAYEYTLDGRYPITDTIELIGGVGFSDVNTTFEYNYLYSNLGFSYFYRSAAISVRYVVSNWTNERTQPPNKFFDPHSIEDKLVLSVSVGF